MITLTNAYLTMALMWIPLSLLAVATRKYINIAPAVILKTNYILFIASGVLAMAITLIPQKTLIKFHNPLTQIPAAIEQTTKTVLQLPAIQKQNLNLPTPTTTAWALLQSAVLLQTLLAITGLLRALYRIRKTLHHAYKLKQIHKIQIYISDTITSPFATTTGFKHVVVLPQWSLVDWQKRKIYLQHELQHIRQGDTRAALALTALQWAYGWNPFFWLWKSKLEQIQEISCDCFLIGHKKIDLREYTNCLLETHQKAWDRAHAPLGMTLAFWRHQKQLLWRVKSMKDYKKNKNRKTWMIFALIPMLVCGMIGTAYASKSLHRRTISKETVSGAMETLILGQSQLPISAEVTRTLAEIMNSPKQRKFYREGMNRLKDVDRVIDTEMMNYGVPRELKAMALVESGVQNLPPQKGIFERSTGVWQIIGGTARVLGLTVVDTANDERMDIAKATNAAIRYISMNRARFDNWDLSVLSYNAGENAVAQAIKTAGSKDPMEVRKYLPRETQAYYTKVIAAAVILQNPSLVED